MRAGPPRLPITLPLPSSPPVLCLGLTVASPHLLLSLACDREEKWCARKAEVGGVGGWGVETRYYQCKRVYLNVVGRREGGRQHYADREVCDWLSSHQPAATLLNAQCLWHGGRTAVPCILDKVVRHSLSTVAQGLAG